MQVGLKPQHVTFDANDYKKNPILKNAFQQIKAIILSNHDQVHDELLAAIDNIFFKAINDFLAGQILEKIECLKELDRENQDFTEKMVGLIREKNLLEEKNNLLKNENEILTHSNDAFIAKKKEYESKIESFARKIDLLAKKNKILDQKSNRFEKELNQLKKDKQGLIDKFDQLDKKNSELEEKIKTLNKEKLRLSALQDQMGLKLDLAEKDIDDLKKKGKKQLEEQQKIKRELFRVEKKSKDQEGRIQKLELIIKKEERDNQFNILGQAGFGVWFLGITVYAGLGAGLLVGGVAYTLFRVGKEHVGKIREERLDIQAQLNPHSSPLEVWSNLLEKPKGVS